MRYLQVIHQKSAKTGLEEDKNIPLWATDLFWSIGANNNCRTTTAGQQNLSRHAIKTIDNVTGNNRSGCQGHTLSDPFKQPAIACLAPSDAALVPRLRNQVAILREMIFIKFAYFTHYVEIVFAKCLAIFG